MIWAFLMLAAYLQRLTRAVLASALILIIAIIDWRVQAKHSIRVPLHPADLAGGTVLPLCGVLLSELICTIRRPI
jgi:hypothetical protein